MIQRTTTTVVLWLVFIALLWLFGRIAAVWIMTILALATQHELYGLLVRVGQRPFRKLGLVLGAAMILGPYAVRTLTHTTDIAGVMAVLIAAAVTICCVRILAEREPEQRFDTLSATLFGIVYVPFMFHFFVEVFFLPDNATHGLMLAVWLVVVVKFCDTGALLVGTAWGRHPLAPTISPKKTWEGVMGGLVSSMLVGVGLILLFRPYFPVSFTPWLGALAAVPIAWLAILSDLVESMIKRRAGVKDSGRTVPGIGGAFDLTDSLILTAPAGYLLFRYLL